MNPPIGRPVEAGETVNVPVLDAKDFRKIGHAHGCICVQCEDMRKGMRYTLKRERIRRRT